MLEKKFVVLPNKETYAYLDQGEGEIFLLIHGNLSSSLHFLPLFNRMKNVRLVAPDMRGFGDSSYINSFSSLLELAKDVKMFADVVGISGAHVVGWSTGGGVGFELAAKYAEFVKSLFIIEGVGYNGYPLLKKKADGTYEPFATREELADDPAVKPLAASLVEKNESFMNMIWEASIYTGNKPSPEENKIYIAETLKQRNLIDTDLALAKFNMSGEHNGYTKGSGDIGNIRCPVAFTCGELDLLIPPATSRANAAVISGSKLLEYQKCGHSPMVDCPDRLVADILANAGVR